ncbi:MAG: serpin family protein [Thermoplasmatota archaeon]
MKLHVILTIIVAIILIGAAMVIVVQNYRKDSDQIDDIPSNGETPDAVGNLSFHDAVNAFSFELFKELFDSDENQFISAYSIFTALSMTYEGAKGETAKQMKQVLQVEQDNASFHQYMKNLYDSLNTKNDYFDISTANALWVKENLELLDAYLAIIKEYYGGQVSPVDYGQPVQAAEIINQWVENQTNGLITDLIDASMITPLTVLILTNAIYFKGIWKTQFEPENTTLRPFTTSSDSIVEVETMSLLDMSYRFSYTENDFMKMLELPYSGEDISMMVMLPKNNDLGSLVDMLDYEMFSSWVSSLNARNVEIYLPKFEVETEYSLIEFLKNIGMDIPFTANADFSLITGNKDLFISSVVHKAFIEVNEQGTEAAAATGIVLPTSVNGSPSPIIFDCNQPFLYLIYHKQTDTILFMGTIEDPS